MDPESTVFSGESRRSWLPDPAAVAEAGFARFL